MEGVRVIPNNFTIFLFEIDQLEDVNSTRNAEFRVELAKFLGLKKALPMIPRANVNLHKTAYPESIDICNSHYDDLRASMLTYVQQTASWILASFVKSRDFRVANADHFVDLVNQWNHDPCEEAGLLNTSALL